MEAKLRVGGRVPRRPRRALFFPVAPKGRRGSARRCRLTAEDLDTAVRAFQDPGRALGIV
jgi:hypothetical protein